MFSRLHIVAVVMASVNYETHAMIRNFS